MNVYIVDTKEHDGGWGNAAPFASAKAVEDYFANPALTTEASEIRHAIEQATANPGTEFCAPGDWDEAWFSVVLLEMQE